MVAHDADDQQDVDEGEGSDGEESTQPDSCRPLA